MSTSANRSLDGVEPTSGPRSATPQARLRNKLDQIRSQGLGPILRKGFRDHVYRTREFVITEYLLEPHGPPPDPAAHKGEMVIAPGDPMPDFRRHFGDAKAARCEATIRAGNLCYVVIKDGAVVALCFCALQDHHEAADGLCYPVRQGEAYFFGHLVPPSQRGFALYSRLLRYAAADLSARGCHRLYGSVEPWNLNALGPQLFLGFREAGEIIHLRRFLWWSWSTKETYAGLRYARFQRRQARSRP